jgi:transposase
MGQHIRITLTPEQKENIKERIQSTSERNIADRLRAVLYKADGYENKEIAYLLQLESINTVTNWLHIYDQQGLDSLCTFKYAGSEPYLNEEQRLMLIFQLKTHIYHTAKQVIAWVMEQFDIQYSLRGMHILLRRLDFTYKKGRLVPSKADPEIQRQFVVAYNQLCSQLGPDDRIYFGDAAHFRHNAETTYSWSEVGNPHVIPTNSGRTPHNVIGVYCIQTHESFFIQTPDNINSATVIELLKGLQEKHPSPAKIYVILDNARSHHAKDVSLYCASSNIILVFLPTYSPNLNVIERLWKFLRKKVFKDHYYATLDQFVSAIKDFLAHLERYMDELVTLMTDNFEIIPSAWFNSEPVANSQI